MKLIVITQEDFFEGEASAVNQLFEAGLEWLHVRKPHSTESEMMRFLQKIDSEYHPFIVLHDHFQLTKKINLKGIHLNRRNGAVPEGFQGSISRSCHSITELTRFSEMDYLFLSPIFNSISKKEYKAVFSEDILLQSKKENIINERIMALGGVTNDHISQLKSWGFGGVAVLGYLWSYFSENHDEKTLIARFLKLKNTCHES